MLTRLSPLWAPAGQAQENLARRSLVPFPEIVPIHPLRRPELCQHASLGALAGDASAEEVGSIVEPIPIPAGP
eukprot:8492091-Pyramimonas_sp.AAC.1